MLKIIPSPQKDIVELRLDKEISVLSNAASSGFKFLVLPIENNLEAINWIIASFFAPIAIVPISANLPEQAKAKIVNTLPINETIELSLLKSKFKDENENLLSIEKDLKEIWAVIFTSGTSGEPKGVAISGNALRNSALAHRDHLSLTHDHSWLLNLPLYHIGGLSVLTRAYFLSSTVATASTNFDLDEFLVWLQSGRVCGLSIVPTILNRILSTKLLLAPSIRYLLLGGASVDESLYRRGVDAKLPLLRTYGMTENCSQIATETAVGCGLKPLPGTKIRIASDGEIFISSNHLFLGYFQKGQLDPAPLNREGYFPTGDLGQFNQNFLLIKGRKTDLIISGGINVYPQEIENVMCAFEGLLDFAVSSRHNLEWGEQIVAVYVSSQQDSEIEERAKNYLSSKIDSKKIPKIWMHLNSIPRTSGGKIMRNVLKDLVSKVKVD